MASADSIRADGITENISNDVTVSGANQFIIIWMDFNDDESLNLSRLTYRYLWQHVDVSVNRFTNCTLCYNRVLSLRDRQEKLFVVVTDPKQPMIQNDLFILWSRLLIEPQVTKIYIIQTKLELSFYRYWIQFKQHQIIQFIPNEILLLEQLTNNRNTNTIIICLDTGTSEIFDVNSYNFDQIFTDVKQCFNYVVLNRHQQMILVINSQNSKIFHYKIAVSKLFSTEYYVYIFSKLLTIYILTSTRTKQIGIKKTDVFTNFSLFRKHLEQDCSPNSPYLSHNEQIYFSSREPLPVSLRSVSTERFFYYTNIITEMPQTLEAKREMIEECREYYKDTPRELEKIAQFDYEYHEKQNGSAIWWYTQDSFLYRRLNEACRTQDIDLIYTFRNFISDLSKQLEEQHSKFFDDMFGVPIKVYRGQLISINELNQLRKNLGHLYVTNTFLSTTGDRSIALAFATENVECSDLISVLFEYNIDTSFETKRPYADIRLLSSKPNEQEVLFCIGTIFQVESIEQKQLEQEQNNYIYWHITMKLIAGNDNIHFESHKEFVDSFEKTSVLLLLGQLAQRNSHVSNDFSKAERYYRLYLEQVCLNKDDNYYENLIRAYESLASICMAKDEYASGFDYYENILKICSTLPGPLWLEEEEKRYTRIIACYCIIALTYRWKTNDYYSAIETYQKLLEYLQNQEYRCSSCIIQVLLLICNCYRKQNRWSIAIDYYRKVNALSDNNIEAVQEHLEDTEEKLAQIQSRYSEILFVLLLIIWFYLHRNEIIYIDSTVIWTFIPLSLIRLVNYYVIQYATTTITNSNRYRLTRFDQLINKLERKFQIYQLRKYSHRFFSHIYNIIPPFTSFLTRQLLLFININMFNYQSYFLIIAILSLAMFDPMIFVVIKRTIMILFIVRYLSDINYVQCTILILFYYFCQQHLLFLFLAYFVLLEWDLQFVARQKRRISPVYIYDRCEHFHKGKF